MDYFVFTGSSFFQQISRAGECDYSTLYREFAETVFHHCMACDNYHQLILTLIYTETELQTLYDYRLSHEKDECKEYTRKAILLVHHTLEVLKKQLPPKASTFSISSENKLDSPLHWHSSLINLMELIASLDYSELITDSNGKRLSFAGIVSAFEKLFNVSIPKPYDLRADLSRRKKHYSVLLPKLKEAFEKNIINCGNGK